jgi:acetolactate decarboxylase
MSICCNKKLFQVGALCGFIDKVYQGDHTMNDLALKGNFGIGTFDLVHGEMIGFDGKFYRVIEDGIARKVDPNHKTPFAWVVDFEETHTFTLDDIKSFDHFAESFDSKIPSHNFIYAYRIECPIEHIQFRAEACQPRPFRPLAETFPSVQKNFELSNVSGIIAGFRFPEYFSTLNIPGHHMHFLEPELMQGGHIFDIKFKKAAVSVCAIKNYELALVDSQAFADLNIGEQDLEEATHAVEKQKSKE